MSNAKTNQVVIPFPVVRLMLPWDGEIVGFYPAKGKKGYNQWPKNKNKGSFFQHSGSVEIAFGWVLRAQEKHRKHQKQMHPGMTDKGGYIALRGGWRAHKDVPVVSDFFDGTFTACLYLEMKGNRLIPRIDGFDVKWNRNIIADAASTIAIIPRLIIDHFIKDLEREQEEKLNLKFATDLPVLFGKAINGEPKLKRKVRRVNLSVKGTSIVLNFDTSRPLNPNKFY